MTVDQLLVKLKSRINKLDSNDYDNLEVWQLLEAYNRTQLLFVRSNLHGGNIYREGDEASKRRIDDFSRLIISYKPTLVKKKGYYEFTLPLKDYMLFKRIDITAEKCGCVGNLICYLGEEANVNNYLSNVNLRPSFYWRETFFTMSDGKVKIYNGWEDHEEFEIKDCIFTYYRFPKFVAKAGNFSLEQQAISPIDIDPEFSDDLVEVIISFTASLISGDIKDQFGFEVNKNVSDSSN